MSFVKMMKSLLSSFDVQKGVKVSPEAVQPRQEWTALASFSLLFFSWGLAYGLLDIMNYHIKVAMGISRGEATYLAMAYYLAYIPGALGIGGPAVKRAGYRFAAVLGLVLLGVGDQIMSVGAQMLSLGLMCGAHFLVGLGVSTLERCANAYTVECGPRKRATLRILIAQSWAAVGTIVAPVLAKTLIFDKSHAGTAPAPDLNHVGKCLMPPPPSKGSAANLKTVVSFYRYLGGGIFSLAVVLGLVFYRTTWVPEVRVPQSPLTEHKKLMFWKHPLFSKRYLRLWYGAVANFFNLGCQVTFAQFFIEHMRVNACATESEASSYMAAAQGVFVVGRVLAANLVALPSLMKVKLFRSICKPRHILACFVGLAVSFTGACIAATGRFAVAAACLVMFAEAPSFPTIFEVATAGFEEWTPTAESIMIVSISGGGLLPFLMGILADRVGVSDAWALVTGCFGVVFVFTVMCNLGPSFSSALDASHGEHVTDKERDIELNSRPTSADFDDVQVIRVPETAKTAG